MLLLSLILAAIGLTLVSLVVHSYFAWRAYNVDADILGEAHPDFPNADLGYWDFIRFEYWRN